MAAYLRSLFGGQNSTPGHGKAKSHRRTESNPTPAPHYVYAAPQGNIPMSASGTSLSKAQRANSYNTTPAIVPSPLRYPTYDSRTSHDGSRPVINRSAGSKPPPDAHGRFPQYPQGGYVTPGSSRSNSSSSLYPGPVYGTAIVPSPLVPSMPRSKTSDSRPSTGQSNAHPWQAGVSTSASGSSTYGPEPSPTKSQARAPRFHMHPVLSYTRLHHAPISYDISFTPSARTVVDRTIHAPVPAVTLAQPATEPPIPASSRLVLRSPKLPWTVAVGPIGSPPSFFIGKSGHQRKATTSAALTNLDVLYAVHTTLMTRVTPEEWAALGEGSRAQRRVAEAYKQRCTRMGGGWEGGIRRVDWLGSKTHLVGVEIDKSNEAGENVGRLVFGRA
ncbi:hypothetical protein EDB84DRAFT_1559678 [Lactarius hengduanensis]|nr:hypothetical protein EDB84DRAFT_1559678 [Lactarius hengduanensis]